MADEELKIILKVQGEEDVRRLKAQIEAEERSMLQLVSVLKAAGTAHIEADRGVRLYAQGLADLNKQLAGAERQLAQGGGGFGKLGPLFNQLGYAVDDLQSGFRGISNNIQPILMAIPGLGAIAGIISAATIAAYNFLPPLSKIAEGLGLVAEKGGLAGNSVADLTARLKTLEEKSPKFEQDYKSIDEYKKKLEGLKTDLEAFDAARKKPTESQKIAASNAEELLKRGETGDKTGAENLQELVKTGLEKQGVKGIGDLLTRKRETERMIQESEKAVNDPEGDTSGFHAAELKKLKPELDKINKEIGASSDEQARAIVGGYVHGTEEGRKKLRELAEKDPEAFKKAGFGREFAADLGKSGDQLKDEGSIAEQRQTDLEEIARHEKESEDFDKKQEKEKVDALEAEKKQFEKNLLEEQQQAKELGHDIVAGKGQVGNAAVMGTLTEEDVKKFLDGIGSSADALMVLTAAQEEAARVVTKTASHEGVDRDTAAKKLVADRDQQEADQAKSKLDKGVRAAKEAMPGVEDVIKDGLKAGMSDAGIFQALRGQLGDAVAGKLVQEGRGKVSEENLDKFMNPEKKEVRKSEVIGAAEFASHVQSAVGNEQNNKMKEQTQKLEAIRQILTAISQVKGGAFVK